MFLVLSLLLLRYSPSKRQRKIQQITVTASMMSGKDYMLEQPFNRLLLLYTLQVKHMVNQTNSDDIRFYQDVLINGIEDEYDKVYDEIADNKNSISKEIAQEVKEIINMYAVIQRSVYDYDFPNKLEFLAQHNIHFNGFSPTGQELEHYIYLSFYKAHYPLNIPISTEYVLDLSDYQEMLERFNPLKQKIKLSPEELEFICPAIKVPAF